MLQSGQRAIQETFTYNNENTKSDFFSAVAQYTDDTTSGTLTTNPTVTFAVSSGEGKFKRARRAVIEYNNSTQQVVELYACMRRPLSFLMLVAQRRILSKADSVCV